MISTKSIRFTRKNYIREISMINKHLHPSIVLLKNFSQYVDVVMRHRVEQKYQHSSSVKEHRSSFQVIFSQNNWRFLC